MNHYMHQYPPNYKILDVFKHLLTDIAYSAICQSPFEVASMFFFEFDI